MRRVPGHPRASDRSPYVFEHILVMEDMLAGTCSTARPFTM
jgi:hypothetical protein